MNAVAPALDPTLLDSEVGSFAIDSREVQPGGMFFALSQPEYRDNGFNGDFEDSTKYAAAALDRGAIAAVVRPDRFAEHQAALDGRSGRRQRGHLGPPRPAVTGAGRSGTVARHRSDAAASDCHHWGSLVGIAPELLRVFDAWYCARAQATREA